MPAAMGFAQTKQASLPEQERQRKRKEAESQLGVPLDRWSVGRLPDRCSDVVPAYESKREETVENWHYITPPYLHICPVLQMIVSDFKNVIMSGCLW